MWGLVCYKDKGGGGRQLAACCSTTREGQLSNCRNLSLAGWAEELVEVHCSCLAPKLTVTIELLRSSSHSPPCLLSLLWCTSLKIPGVHMYLLCPGGVGGLLCLFESCDPNPTPVTWALYVGSVYMFWCSCSCQGVVDSLTVTKQAGDLLAREVSSHTHMLNSMKHMWACLQT